MSLTIAVPCLNEEKNIIKLLRKLANIKLIEPYEVIVINDGSSDNSKNVVSNYIKNNRLNNFRLINHKRNLGLGMAFKTALLHCKTKKIIVIPGDNENDPNECLRHYNITNNVDIVIPFIVNSNERNLFRLILSKLYIRIINLFFFTKLNYSNGTIIYSTESLKSIKIKSNGFFYNTEILIKLIKSGYTYAEVPSMISKRNMGKSKAITLNSLYLVIKNFIWLFFQIMILKKRYQISKQSITYINYK